MKNFEYIYPKNVTSIPAILAENPDKSLLFAGGTDAISRMKEGLIQPQRVINLKAVEELNYIREDSDGLRVGATTTLFDFLENKALNTYQGLKEAAHSIASIQLRNLGTVAGNLCQRPRCWYFRSRHFPCLRKKGDICFAVNGQNKYHCILGGGPCFIVHPSDLAPMLLALDASVTVISPEDSKQIKIENLYVLPEQDTYKEMVLAPQEFISEVLIPKTSKKSHYLKFKERKSLDFAMVSVALAADVSGRALNNVRVSFGGVAPVPWRASKAENILEGQAVSEDIVEQAALAELKAAEPLEQNEYKIILAKNLLKRAVRELMS